MYKVMIIDDYSPILKYVHQLINWNELGLQVVETAHSSIIALQRFAQTLPDLLITDIGMPQMNGIQLAEKCKEIKPDVRIIFLTCHEEFEYAKGALKLQADDYLIKDELTKEQLTASLKQSVQMIKVAEESIAGFAYREEVQRNKNEMEKIFIQRLFNVHENIEETIQHGKKIGLDWEKPLFMIGLGCLNLGDFYDQYERKDRASIQYAFYNIASEMAKHFTAAYPNIHISPLVLEAEDAPYVMMFVINYQEQLACNVFQEIERAYFTKLRQNMKDYIRIDVRFTCSEPFEKLEHFRKTYQTLRQYDHDFYYEDGHVQFTALNKFPRWNDANIDFMAHFTDKIATKLKKKDFSDIQSDFQDVAKRAKKQHVDPTKWLDACAHWIRLIHTETNMMISEYFYFDLSQSTRWKETVQLMDRKMKAAAHSLSAKHRQVAKDPILEQVDQYIFDHISENITLAAMAKHLYLNPNYFSRHFKKISGQNFIDYMHRHKVELAAKLLFNPYASVESVALKLGYSDRTYFARVFKKYMKVSPSEYRK